MHFRELLLTATASLACSSCATSNTTVARTSQTPNAIIHVCADSQGKPFDITMIQSSGNKEVDRIIMRVAKSWKFPPVKRDGTTRKECENVPVPTKFNN